MCPKLFGLGRLSNKIFNLVLDSYHNREAKGTPREIGVNAI